MKLIAFISLFFVLFFCLSISHNRVSSNISSNEIQKETPIVEVSNTIPPSIESLLVPQEGPPIIFAPNSDSYIVKVGQPLIIDVLVDCSNKNPELSKIEILSPNPMPDFIAAQQPCLCAEVYSKGQIVIAPKAQNAGKHDISIRATSCTGFAEIYTFRIKVKG